MLPASSTFASFSRFVVAGLAFCCAAAPLISTAPQDAVTDLAGRPLDPFRPAPQKTVVFIFVRTDCPISNRYAPLLRQISSQHQRDASFFLVYPDKRETPAMIREHVRQFAFGPAFTALRDPAHILVKQSQAQITPEAAVFDLHQRLVYQGRIDNLYEDFGHARRIATTHELADAIESARTGNPLPAAPTPAVGCYISDLE